MMKPSESTGAMHEHSAAVHRAFNQTQNAQFSEEKMPRNFDDELVQAPEYLSTTMSPGRHRGRNANNFTTADDATTADATRANAYQSAQKVRLAKKSSVEGGNHMHGMSATIHTTNEALPNVRGASKSKRTLN